MVQDRMGELAFRDRAEERQQVADLAAKILGAWHGVQARPGRQACPGPTPSAGLGAPRRLAGADPRRPDPWGLRDPVCWWRLRGRERNAGANLIICQPIY